MPSVPEPNTREPVTAAPVARRLVRWWRRLAPAPIARRVSLWRHGPHFAGDFSDWETARAQCLGYDHHRIVADMVTTARAVRQGEASWERDGTLFSQPAHNRPLLDALLTLAPRDGTPLRVVDFGGALGSTWWQHRDRLDALVGTWDIVEQPEIVACGQAEFSQPPLRFHTTIAEACAGTTPSTIIFSSVLQYLPDPFSILREVHSRAIQHVIFDRTPFVTRERHRLTVQSNGGILRRVRSYPGWFFNQSRLFAENLPGYHLTTTWPGFDTCALRNSSFSGGVLTRSQS